MAEAALPTTPDEIDAQTKDGRRDDTTTRDQTKTELGDGSSPANRKESRGHAGEVTKRDNSQELEVVAGTEDAIPVKKHGVNLGRQIAYGSQEAYRSRISNGSDERQPSSEDKDDGDIPGGKMRKGAATRKETRQGDTEEEIIGDYREEPKSHVSHGKHRASPPTSLDEDTGGGGINESPRSARNEPPVARVSRLANQAAPEKAADISQTAQSRYRNVDILDFPSCIRQTIRRATDPRYR